MPPDETLDEVIEGLVLNAEMVAVSQLLAQEGQTMIESDSERLVAVRKQIRALKEAEHPVVRLVSPDGPVEHKVAWRRWADVPESGKRSMLKDLVDWTGISNRDMAHMLLSELDVGKLSTGQRDQLIRLAEPQPARGKVSLEELKHLATGQKNGNARSKEHSLER